MNTIQGPDPWVPAYGGDTECGLLNDELFDCNINLVTTTNYH